jgi:aconitase B
MYVEDESGAVKIQLDSSSAEPGDIVDIVGYPTPTENGATLTSTVVSTTKASRDNARANPLRRSR